LKFVLSYSDISLFPIEAEWHCCYDYLRVKKKNVAAAPLIIEPPQVIITKIFQEAIMGKYFLAWLLGVPFFVLVLVYLIF